MTTIPIEIVNEGDELSTRIAQNILMDSEESDFATDDESTPPDHRQFLKAAENGNLDEIIQMWTDKPDLLNCTDSDGYTALHRASYNGHTDVGEWLISKGANVRALTEQKWTPLHSAAKWGQTKMCSLLIQNGSDVNSQTEGGLTPTHLAAEHARTNRQLIELFVYNPHIDLTIKSKAGDTAYDVAKRKGPYYKLFENV